MNPLQAAGLSLASDLIDSPVKAAGEVMNILKNVGEKYDLPVITDIHTAEEAAIAAEIASEASWEEAMNAFKAGAAKMGSKKESTK